MRNKTIKWVYYIDNNPVFCCESLDTIIRRYNDNRLRSNKGKETAIKFLNKNKGVSND
jgi:hypothetical protein